MFFFSGDISGSKFKFNTPSRHWTSPGFYCAACGQGAIIQWIISVCFCMWLFSYVLSLPLSDMVNLRHNKIIVNVFQNELNLKKKYYALSLAGNNWARIIFGADGAQSSVSFISLNIKIYCLKREGREI